jgi:hypothetical protein
MGRTFDRKDPGRQDVLMPERPDLRQVAASLREAAAGLDRDALVDVLTHVLSEYVIEGPPPLAAHQVERLEDLAGLSLAELVAALQTRLDVPGLELLRVAGGQVQAHTAGGWVALQAPREPVRSPAASEGGAGERASAQAPTSPRPTTGRAAADEALSRGRGDLLGGERGVITPPAPRPRGVSVTARSTAPAPSPSPAPAPADPPAPPAAPTARDEPGEPKQDDASIRFSLLELD